MIDPSVRLRRAIHLNDLPLLRRILKSNPTLIQNPDFTDNGNTSLHLAASLCLYDIALFLIDAGHEDGGISRNWTMDTPLHLAVECKDNTNSPTSITSKMTAARTSTPADRVPADTERVAELLARRFTRCIGWRNAAGLDTIMLATHHPTLPPTLLSTLLALTLFSPAPTSTPTPSSISLAIPGTGSTPPYHPLLATDPDGNTPLHHASAFGALKAIRILLEHGADPYARNNWSWTPVSYSASVQAEVYFRGLVSGQGGEVGSGGRSRGGSGGKAGGVRLVGGEEGGGGGRGRSESGGRGRAGSGE